MNPVTNSIPNPPHDPPHMAAPDVETGPPTYLTPDALMAYCQAQLGDFDSQFRSAFKEQGNVNQEQQWVSSLVSQFQNYSTGVNDQSTCQNLESSIEAVVKQIQQSDPGSPAIAQLEQIHDNVMGSGAGPYTDSNGAPHTYLTPGHANTGHADQDNVLSSDEMTGFVTALQGVNSDLNSGAELQMIQLQSLMSQRQTCVQMTTNLVQSLGDQTQKITENIGH